MIYSTAGIPFLRDAFGGSLCAANTREAFLRTMWHTISSLLPSKGSRLARRHLAGSQGTGLIACPSRHATTTVPWDTAGFHVTTRCAQVARS